MQPACPTCGRFNLKRINTWFWRLNPALCVNELVLGQRLPKTMFVCQECQVPYLERQFVLCPSCKVVHDGRIWSGRCAFGNWLGLVCPNCKARIPSLFNFTSALLLLITSPIWYLPYRFFFKTRAASGPQLTAKKQMPLTPLRSARMGLGFAIPMWILSIYMPVLLGTEHVTLPLRERFVLGATPALLAGIVFGIGIHLRLNRKPKKRQV